MATEAHLGPLEAAIIAIVDARIAKALGDRDTKPVYGSREPYSPIPGKSHRWTREHAAEMGGERRGGRRGRDVVWIVTHEQYTAWLASKTADGSARHDVARSEAAPFGASSKPATVTSIDDWISAGGYRATRAAR